MDNALKIIIVGAILILIFMPTIYFIGKIYNPECLDNYAKKYCEENNMDYQRSSLDRFYCKQKDLRKDRMDNFKFLEEEKESCISKDYFSFRSRK